VQVHFTAIKACADTTPHLRDVQVHLIAIKVCVERAAHTLVEAQRAEGLDLGPERKVRCEQHVCK